MNDPTARDESRAVAERYARRAATDRYGFLQPDVLLSVQCRQRALQVLLRRAGIEPAAASVFEVGCGAGGNLLELLRMGFRPANLGGIELLPERAAQAREVLPAAVRLHEGDATALDLAPGSVDIVYQSTVFSSLLDDAFQQRLAETMWRWVRPGGAVLWYDFTVDNPRNPDVRGVPLSRVRALFPRAELTHRRVTLAPPLARALCRVSPRLVPWFDWPPLRTHVLAWLRKPV